MIGPMVARRSHLGLGLLVAVTVPLALVACGPDTPPPPTSFAPLSYAYLRPLRINVGSIDTTDEWAPGPGDLSLRSPANPLTELHDMGRDRLVAAGASGRAVFGVEQASIIPAGGSLNGLLKVRLDVYTSDGKRAAYAEAAVARSSTAPDDDDAMPAALYALTKQMMSDMNVEFEFQLRRSLGDWLQAGGPAPPPAPVQSESLAPPGSAPTRSGPPPAFGAPRPGQGFRLVPVAPTTPP